MSTEYVRKSFEESEKERIEKENIAKKRMEQMRLNTYNLMKNNTAIQEYLQQFNTSSQEDFMRQYAFCKSLFMEYADIHSAYGDSRGEGNIKKAQARLVDIQQKKLFDVLLQWNANMIKLPGIECSWDFFKWKSHITECPFITPISQPEFDLYMKYANSPGFDCEEDIDLLGLALDSAEDEEELPEWFMFENLHTGNNKYLLLPRLRTQKENFYRDLSRKEVNVKVEKKYETGELKRNPPDIRPMAPIYYYRGIEDYVKRFENREALNKFYRYYEYNSEQLIRDTEEEEQHTYLNERVDNIVFSLKDVKEKIPVKAGSDWRQALIDAYDNYNKQQVISGLQYAYSDYCNRIANGMSYVFNEEQFKQMELLANNIRTQVLRGRELNGEERNFDF